MREIKFRSWDKFKKEMRKVDKMDFHNKKSIIVWFLNGEKILYPRQSTEIMQYTGLKDKKGVEIYEGDIVEFEGGVFLVSHDDENACYVLQTMRRGELKNDRNLNGHAASVCKVIGNIYQNTKLLERKK